MLNNKTQIYDTEAFAELIKKSVSTLIRWDKDGTLKAKKNFRGRRYYTDDDFNLVYPTKRHQCFFKQGDIVGYASGYDNCHLFSIIVVEFNKYAESIDGDFILVRNSNFGDNAGAVFLTDDALHLDCWEGAVVASNPGRIILPWMIK